VDQRLQPGPRDHLLTREIERLLRAVDPSLVERAPLDATEAPSRLARHLARVIERELGSQGGADAVRQATTVNQLIPDDERLVLPPEVWTGLRRAPIGLGDRPVAVPTPQTALSVSDLLVNADGQPNIGSELRAELASADSVDLICAFVIWSGVVQLREALADVVARGGQVRVITTTYMGATQRRAVDALAELGADVRVAFDARTTKLHAKAWLLERGSGLTTAFVGSSNLSHTALFDGLEWNVRLSAVDAGHVIDRVRAMFETHWASEHFELYSPTADAERLDRALGTFRDREMGRPVSFAGIDVRPYPHQERILETLTVERELHDRHRNLVVAATGTGKTVISALDYRGLCERAGVDLSVLFVAHRERILDQSLATFRHVMRSGTFGEKHGGGHHADGRHVFAMVQSLQEDALERVSPDFFDVVIVDEFHHTAAPTYRALLDHVQPKELLALTATPERMDGQDVTEWFGGRIAFELRLWEAIDEGFLVPFQYFGVSDGTDLSDLTWQRGGYRLSELNRLLVNNDGRVVQLVEALNRFVADPEHMRALGFCVSIEHAHYMAKRFTERGLPSVALDGSMSDVERDTALRQLELGELRCVFSVEVLGEGVDVPAVDTVLLLRPTDSATVFTQQLGRGLRHAPNKAHLTVIDLIGQQHRQFRFDRRLSALLDARRGPMREQVSQGFPFLPAGCHVELDRQSEEIVLENLRAAARLGQWRTLVDDLRGVGDVSLSTFLTETDRSTTELYGRATDRSWTRLRRDAGLSTPNVVDSEVEKKLLRAAARMQHVDDPERVGFYLEHLSTSSPPDLSRASAREERLWFMLHLALWGTTPEFQDLQTSLDAFWQHGAVRDELQELFAASAERSEVLPISAGVAPNVPLLAHARYTRDETLGAYGVGSTAKPPQVREGVKHVDDAKTDLFFVTFRKSEREYSPTTMYRDYAISRTLFHWESQATHRMGTPTIERYINHISRGSDVAIFVRDRKETPEGLTAPYWFLGKARYVSATGDRPVAFTWELEQPMPEVVFEVARAVAAT
jgi:superfamily II DNA or RNA helicase/HKD family nuclease